MAGRQAGGSRWRCGSLMAALRHCSPTPPRLLPTLSPQADLRHQSPSAQGQQGRGVGMELRVGPGRPGAAGQGGPTRRHGRRLCRLPACRDRGARAGGGWRLLLLQGNLVQLMERCKQRAGAHGRGAPRRAPPGERAPLGAAAPASAAACCCGCAPCPLLPVWMLALWPGTVGELHGWHIWGSCIRWPARIGTLPRRSPHPPSPRLLTRAR